MTFELLSRTKVFRDPLYGYINVDYKIISELIDTKEMQRLRRIRQLSGVSMVFQTAEHSRFTHSLGAYEMANLVLKTVDGVNDNFTEYEKIVLLASALLHDVGHGPYSHAFEDVLSVTHEEMTAKIITSPKTDVFRVLSSYKGLANDIASVISHQGKYPLIESLISSQLDVDRMDYLSRDAYMTGATYGTIDRNRILRSMIIRNHKLYFKASGVNSIESYIMSRYHMYWQVYYHSKSRAYELLLQSIYKRIKDLVATGTTINANVESLVNVIKNNDDINSYIDLDDSYVNGFIKQLINSDDLVLNTLANAFQNRKLFSVLTIDDYQDKDEIERIKNEYANDSNKKKYYFYKEKLSKQAYLHVDTQNDLDINDIKIYIDSERIVSLEEYSLIIKSLISSSMKSVSRIYYFEDSNE